MATLHFDTDAGRMTSSTMNACKGTIEGELATLTNRVNTLVGGEWIGNSATQFQGEFQTWAGQVRQTLETLETLRVRLDREIEEWLAAASAFE